MKILVAYRHTNTRMRDGSVYRIDATRELDASRPVLVEFVSPFRECRAGSRAFVTGFVASALCAAQVAVLV